MGEAGAAVCLLCHTGQARRRQPGLFSHMEELVTAGLTAHPFSFSNKSSRCNLRLCLCQTNVSTHHYGAWHNCCYFFQGQVVFLSASATDLLQVVCDRVREAWHLAGCSYRKECAFTSTRINFNEYGMLYLTSVFFSS